jgi:serine/threonine protein kinase/heme exporter protein D
MLRKRRASAKGLRETISRDNVYPVNTPTTHEPSDDFSRFAAALAGQYDLEREIGRGGMGIVYLARDVRLDRRVAIKTLPPHLAKDAVVGERFLREARMSGRLSHQNIVPIHRADELGGHAFFVMGYVEGESLAQQIRRQGRVDPRDVVRQLRDVADALAYAHEHGVIHRDVKAENILLDSVTGRALVTDFGIARMAEAAPLTSTGQVLGTVYYLSPEQVSGNAVDARSDIYSLGVVGFFALAGRFPFDAQLASAVLIAHVTKAPPLLHTVSPDTPRELCDVIDRCLAKDPSERFQSCAELLDVLVSVNRAVDETMRNAALAQQQLVSDTEAQAIIVRAADLQASTGLQPRPAPIIGTRDGARPVSDTSGHRLANVRDAAVEAGIAPKYVDHALVEHGLAPSGSPTRGSLGVVARHKSPNAFVGNPTQLQLEIVVDGEMPQTDFDLLVDTIRECAGEAGQLTAVGRSFSWQSNPVKGTLHVTVLPRAGKTTIRVSESLRALATGLFGGLFGLVSGVTAPIWLGIGIGALHSGVFTVAMWTATATLSYASARGLFGRGSRQREAVLRELAETLARQARESIAAASPTIASPDSRARR